MKLRLTIIMPMIGILLVLGVLAYALPDLTRIILIAMPIVTVGGLTLLLFLERRKRESSGQPSGLSTPAPLVSTTSGRWRVVVLVVAAVFILAMSLLIANLPIGYFPVLLAIVILVVIGAVILARYLERRAKK